MKQDFDNLMSLMKNTNTSKLDEFLTVFPQLNKLKTTIQDKHFHAEGDVWTHTKMVCDELFKNQEYIVAKDDSKFVMFYSALLHDISKPVCTKVEDDGRVTSKGHSKMGAVDVRILLWKANVPFDLRERICNIIANHQVPFFAFDDKSKDGKQLRTPEFLANFLSWQLNLNELLVVAKSDMLGRTYVEKQKSIDDIDLFKMICDEQKCLFNPKEFPSVATRMKYFETNGGIDPNYIFHKDYGSKVIVLSGIPASGKNTWVKNNVESNIDVVSFDDEVERLNLKHSGNIGQAVHAATDKAKVLLANKDSFVFNATHLSRQMRDKTIDLVHRYNGEVKIVYLEAPYEEILKRNSQRDTTLRNNKIEEMLFKWDVPTKIESEEIEFYPLHGMNFNKKLKVK
jgi:predicted kinase